MAANLFVSFYYLEKGAIIGYAGALCVGIDGVPSQV